MINLRKNFTLVIGVLGAATIATGVLIACSSDTSVDATDAGTDGGTDAPGDTQKADTSTPGDAGPDVITVEAGTLADFLTANATATCVRAKECCALQTDAGFDLAACGASLNTSGWDQSLADLTAPGVAAGKITYDPAVGSQCLTAIRNMTCANTTAAEFKNAWVKCFAAATGTVANGQPCASNAECKSSEYCDPTALGDAGACAALKAANAACKPFAGDCSYRNVGSVQCIDDGTDAGTRCLPPLANGKDCIFDWECASGACYVRDTGGGNIVSTCDTKTDFTFGICDAYKPDGG